MTDFGCTLFSVFGALFLLGIIFLARWARRLEGERIEVIAAERGWTVVPGRNPRDWTVEGEEDGRKWVLGVRRPRRRGKHGATPRTELTIVVDEGPLLVFAGPRPPAALEGLVKSAKDWMLQAFTGDASMGEQVDFIEMPTDTLLVATNDEDPGRAFLEGLEGDLESLRPMIARYGKTLRVQLSGEVRDGKTLEALIDLGVRLADRA